MAGDKQDAEKEAKELADAGKDLNSPDKQKREQAEKALDKQMSQEARQQLQQDLQSADPKKREAAQKQVKDAVDRLKGKFDPNNRGNRAAGPATTGRRTSTPTTRPTG